MSYSRQESLTITAQKKKECNTKALRIVESMLDESVNPDWLLDNLKYISQSHFQDAIEERAISKQCGYPLCNAPLGNVPSQQFRISVKTNKVYDITERKYFCSNLCYKSAQFLKEQLLTSPVWLREIETIPTFQLLPPTSPGGDFGKEVQFDCDLIPSVERDEQQHFSNEVSSSPVLSEECSEDRSREEIREEKMETLDRGILIEDHREEAIGGTPPRENSLAAVDEGTQDRSNRKDICDKPSKRKSKTSKNSEKPINYVSYVGRIEQCFSEWFTIDSLIFIYGTEKAKDMLKDRVGCLKGNSHYSKIHTDPVTERRYNSLCKKLNLLEIEGDLGSDGVLRKESKPLPNVEQLREDAKLMEIKVKDFYKGDKVVSFKDEPKISDRETSGIPLVDSYAQNALRRRIILDRLQHILPDLLRTLGMTSTDFSEDVRGLFMTFSLKADNITFKPGEWNLIGLIILKMLSMRNTKLKTLMETKLAQKYCSMILLTFQLDYGYLDVLLTSLCEADSLINV